MATKTGFQSRARIERLESLLKRALAAAAAASASFAGPVVANEAAAAAFPLSDVPNGRTQVFVLSHRSIWTKKNGVPGTVGVPALSPHEVIATTAGTPGVLTRTNYSDPALRIDVNDVWIDPSNPAANDENSGLTAGAPLKTGMELFRRWGWGNQVIVGPNIATSPDGFTNIHIVSSISAPDQLPMNVILVVNGSLRFIGGTPTTVLASTALTAVTAMNSATNTKLQLTAGALVWAPFIAANRRGRILDGAAAGATFQVHTDLGAGAAAVSAAQTTNEPGFSVTPTTVTPAPGDHFVIESLVQVNVGMPFAVAQQNNPAFSGQSFVNVVNLNIPLAANQVWIPTSSGAAGTNGAQFNFYQCTFDRPVDYSDANAVSVASYYFNAGITNLGFKGFIACLEGGAANGNALYSIILAGNHEDVTVDSDFIANRCPAFTILGPVRNFAATNATALAGFNPGAHAIFVGAGGPAPFFSQRGVAVFKGRAWGSGGAGRGIYVASACQAVGAPQVATGIAGDFALSNRTTGWFFDAAAAVYNPAAGPIAFSWANLAAAQPGGFAGDAHNPVNDAHWVPAETAA